MSSCTFPSCIFLSKEILKWVPKKLLNTFPSSIPFQACYTTVLLSVSLPLFYQQNPDSKQLELLTVLPKFQHFSSTRVTSLSTSLNPSENGNSAWLTSLTTRASGKTVSSSVATSFSRTADAVPCSHLMSCTNSNG